jgi:hypothetical protein
MDAFTDLRFLLLNILSYQHHYHNNQHKNNKARLCGLRQNFFWYSGHFYRAWPDHWGSGMPG